MKPPLWMTVSKPRAAATGGAVIIDVGLAVCRNCGKPKAISDPCGFDHLAAILEFAAAGVTPKERAS